jgi:hypothetical protein
VQYVTLPSAASAGASLTVGTAIGSVGITTSRAVSSVYRPTGATSGASQPTPSAPALPAEIGLYEGLISPAGQAREAGQPELCLSGDIFDPSADPDEDDDDDDDVNVNIAARQLESQTLISSASVPFRSAASSVRATGVTATATRSGTTPSSSASVRPRGPQDGLIALRPCNASDPAQWWRLGADVRVTVRGVAPGQGWKLSLRNQSECASMAPQRATSRVPPLWQTFAPLASRRCVVSRQTDCVWEWFRTRLCEISDYSTVGLTG